MVAESMCQAYFLHELIPCVLALHKTQLEKNMESVHEGKKLFLCIVIFYASFQLGILCKAITKRNNVQENHETFLVQHNVN